MAAMFALIVEEIRRQSDLDIVTATERAHEMLLPVREQRAAANRRAFGNLLAGARRPSQDDDG